MSSLNKFQLNFIFICLGAFSISAEKCKLCEVLSTLPPLDFRSDATLICGLRPKATMELHERFDHGSFLSHSKNFSKAIGAAGFKLRAPVAIQGSRDCYRHASSSLYYLRTLNVFHQLQDPTKPSRPVQNYIDIRQEKAQGNIRFEISCGTDSQKVIVYKQRMTHDDIKRACWKAYTNLEQPLRAATTYRSSPYVYLSSKKGSINLFNWSHYLGDNA